MTHRLHNVIYGRLDAIAAAEKITRVELGLMSRELLEYVPDTHDIDIVNRLIGVLTPRNRNAAILYFSEFLPWSVEEDKKGEFVRFGKMKEKDKQVKRHMDAIKEFLSDEKNDIWSWSKDNIREVKILNGAVELDKAIERAMKGTDTDTKHIDPLSKAEVLSVLIKRITPDEMLDLLSELAGSPEEKSEGETQAEESAAA